MQKMLESTMDYLCDYRFGEDALEITTLGGALVTRRFPYGQMLEVKPGYEFWNEHYQNRFDSSKAVSIKLDRQFIPWLVLTPEDPEAFMTTLRGRMAPAG